MTQTHWTRILSFIALATFAGATHTPAAHADPDCIAVRAAFDIGSGSTKAKAARVDHCKGQILETLFEGSEPVPYKEALTQAGGADGKKELPESIQKQGLDTLRGMMAKISTFKPARTVAVATAAFRQASNGASFVKRLGEEFDIRASVITQDEEAALAFAAAAGHVRKKATEIAVWDIGGASMQLAAAASPGKLQAATSEIAAVSFKEQVIQNVLGKDPKQQNSPNPLSADQVTRARTLAEKLANDLNWGKSTGSLPKNWKTRELIGVGGVLDASVRKNVAFVGDSYTLKDIEAAIVKLTGKSDSEIGGKYAATDLTNLILIAGCLKSWGVERVRPVSVNLTDGAFLSAKYWK